MGTQAGSDLEQVLQQLHQYGVVLVQKVPEPADLFRDAVLNRLPDGVLLTDISSVEAVQRQLAKLLCCEPSADSILAALKRRVASIPLLVHSSNLSLSALEYLFSLNAVTDEKGIRLPLLLLETDELASLFRSGEGKRLVRRIPLSFPISGSSRSGHQLVLAVSIVALAVGIYGGLQWWPQQSWTTDEVPVQSPVAATSGQPLTASVVQMSLKADAVTSLPLLSLGDQDKVEILETVEQWRSAWQRQDWSAYLASYVDQYLPQGNQLSHESWVSFRRSRLEKPKWIKVAISELKLQILDPYQVRVTFWQAYQAPGYSDRSFKELRLVRTMDSWRIDSERSIK